MNSVLTWEDTGKPRSMGGPFDVLYTPRDTAPPVLTLGEMYAQRNREASRARAQARRANEKAKAAVQLHSLSTKSNAHVYTAKVLRDNTGNMFCPPIRTQDDAGKTMRIQGKPL